MHLVYEMPRKRGRFNLLTDSNAIGQVGPLNSSLNYVSMMIWAIGKFETGQPVATECMKNDRKTAGLQ